MEMKIRCSTWNLPQIGCGGKGGGAWLAGAATKRLLLPRNLCLSGTLEEVCRIWWGLHWRLMSLYCMFFCNKSLYIIFPVFIWKTFVHITYQSYTQNLLCWSISTSNNRETISFTFLCGKRTLEKKNH
jgi:hypothetical protein